MGVLHALPWPFNSRTKSLSIPDASPPLGAGHERATSPAHTSRVRRLSVLGAGAAFHSSLRTPEPASEGPLERPDPTPVPASKYRSPLGPRRRRLDMAGSRSLGPSRRKQPRSGLGPASASFGGARLGRTPRRSLEGAPRPLATRRPQGEMLQGAPPGAQDAFDSMLHTWKVALADEFSNILNDSVICEMSSKGIVLETVVASKQVQVDHRREILLTAILRWGASGEYFAFSVRQPNSLEGIEDVYLRGPHKQIAQMEATFVALVSEYVRAAPGKGHLSQSPGALPMPSSSSSHRLSSYKEHISPSRSGWEESPLQPSPCRTTPPDAAIRSTHSIDARNAPRTPPHASHVPVHVGIRTVQGGSSVRGRSGLMSADKNEGEDAGPQALTRASGPTLTTSTTAEEENDAEKTAVAKKANQQPIPFGLATRESDDASMHAPKPEAGDNSQTQNGVAKRGAARCPPEADKPKFLMERRSSGLVILRPSATPSPESTHGQKKLQLTIPPAASESDPDSPVITPMSHSNLFSRNSPLSRRATPPPSRSPVPVAPASSPLSLPSSLMGAEPETVRVSWRAVNSPSDPRTTPRTFGDDAGADARLADCGVAEALSGVRRQVSHNERSPANRGRQVVSPARSAGWRGGEGAHPRHSTRPAAAADDNAPPLSPQGWELESSTSGKGIEPRRCLESDLQAEFGNHDTAMEAAGVGRSSSPREEGERAVAGAGWPLAGCAHGVWASLDTESGGNFHDVDAARGADSSHSGTSETNKTFTEPGPAAPHLQGNHDFTIGQHPPRDLAQLAESTESIPFMESTESLLSPAPDHNPSRGPRLARGGWSPADAARNAVAACARKGGGVGVDNTDAHSGTGSLVTLCQTWNTASEISGGGTVGGVNSSTMWLGLNADERRRARQQAGQMQAAEPLETLGPEGMRAKRDSLEQPPQSLHALPKTSCGPCMMDAAELRLLSPLTHTPVSCRVGVAVHAPSPFPSPAPPHGSLLGVSLAAVAPASSPLTSRRRSSLETRLDLSCSPAPRKTTRHSSHEVYSSQRRSRESVTSPMRNLNSEQRVLKDTGSNSPCHGNLLGQDSRRAARSSRTLEGGNSDANPDVSLEITQDTFKKEATRLLCVSTATVQVYENTEFDAHTNPTYDEPESPNSAVDDISRSKVDFSGPKLSSACGSRSVSGSCMQTRTASAFTARTGMANGSYSAREAGFLDGRSFKKRSSQQLMKVQRGVVMASQKSGAADSNPLCRLKGSKNRTLSAGGKKSMRHIHPSRGTGPGVSGFLESSQRHKPNSQPTLSQQTAENILTWKHYLVDTVSSARHREDIHIRRSMEAKNSQERTSKKPLWKT